MFLTLLFFSVGMRWRGSEDVVESFSTLCVSILQMLLPTPKQLETEEGREQGRLMEGVMKDMVSYFMSRCLFLFLFSLSFPFFSFLFFSFISVILRASF